MELSHDCISHTSMKYHNCCLYLNRTCLQITKLFLKNDWCSFIYYIITLFHHGKEWSCIRMLSTRFNKPWWIPTMNKCTMKKNETILWNDNLYHWSAVNSWFTMMSVWTIKYFQFNWIQWCMYHAKPSMTRYNRRSSSWCFWFWWCSFNSWNFHMIA